MLMDLRLADTKNRCGRPIKKTWKRLGPLGWVTLNKKRVARPPPWKVFALTDESAGQTNFTRKHDIWYICFFFHYLYIIVYITLHTWRKGNPILSCFNVMVWLKWLFSQFDIHRIAIFCIYEIELVPKVITWHSRSHFEYAATTNW